MKKTYINPSVEVIQFEAEDIMSLSGNGSITYNNNLTDTPNAFNDLWNSTDDF